MDATKYRRCGNRCMGRGSAQEGTRLYAEATTCLSQAPFLARAAGGRIQYLPVLFAIAGT